MRSLFILLQLMFLTGIAVANPSGINLSGKISLQASNTALTAADVDFKIRVLSPDGCILYSEKFLNVDLSATAGVFNLTIGNGTALYNAWDATLGTANSKASLMKVFSNGSVPIASGLTQYPGEVCAGGAYTPTDGDTRKVVIEFDPTGMDNSPSYVALSPFHRIRSVPYAMLADHASDSDKLGGLAASTYAKTADLATSVPAAETDPNVQAFAKTAITGLTAGNCGVGKVLTYNGTSLECVVDGGGGGGGAIATNTVAGSVLVDAGSDVSLNLTTGALDVKNLAISKITGLQTALDDKIGYAAMPVSSCAAGEALVWLTPSNTFDCFAIAVAAGSVTGLDAAVDARIAADTTKLPVAGGTMTGNINMSNNQLSNVGYVHLQNKAADPGGLVAGNEGFVWYNSTDKQIKYYNGTAINALPAYTGACADGQILKWDNTLKVWACAADAGAGGGANATQLQGTNISAVAPTAGQFLKYVGTDWTATSMPVCTADQVMLFNASGVATCTAISGLSNSAIAAAAAIARTKLASGTADHVLINDGSGVMSSEAQLAVTRGGTGQSTYTDGQLLIGNSTGNTLTKGTLTQGAGITITNGNGTITIAADPTTATIADDSIVNADVNSAAAIDRTKLANGTANRVVINTTGGVMSEAAAITAARALISDANGIPTHSTVTGTELSYVSGVTSAIQAQLDALTTGGSGKVAKAGDTMTGNLVMNAEKEVRFADNNSDHFIGLKSPATVAADVTFTLPAADGTAGYVLKTDGTGNLDWVAPAAAPGDASYAAKGVVQFNTDAATSGISVVAGVATVNTGLGADQIVKLPTAGTLPVLNGSALTNLDVGAITSAVGKYFGYKPNGAACADGGVMKWDDATQHWICGTDAGAGGGVDAVTIRGVAVDAAAPAVNKFMQFDGTKWTSWLFPTCGTNSSLQVDALGNISCASISGIVNANIDAAAAIARTKLASGTADHVLINNGSGVMSSEAQLAVTRGGTGQSTYTDGQLLIGNSTGNTLAKATLTQGTGITITNGNGTITIAADPATATIADDSIVNADINTAAAIDRTKLASGTANRVVINTTGGVMSEAAAITAARALISDANGIPTHSTVTGTELGYVSGVTSAIQAQLDALTTGGSGKVAKAGDTMTGNLVMNAQKEVRFADSDSDHFVAVRSPATVAADVTLTLPATAGTAGYVLKTDGAGALDWVAPAAAPGDASYAAKGVVQFNTDVATSGVSVVAGVATVNTGLGADQIVKLPTAGTLPVLNGSALTNLDVGAITSAVGKYFGYKPNGAACADGGVMKWDNATQHWICGTDAGAGGGVDAVTIQGVAVDATLPTVNKFMQFDGTKWTSWLFPTCGTNSTLQVDALGNISCASISGIVNANIDAAAAIARTKLANGTADHVLINNGSGVMSSEAQLSVTRGGTGQSTYTDGQLLIGNSTGNTLSKATLTQGAGVTITNGNGTITIAADPATATIADDSIVNADINTAAAIDRTKLASGTANRVVINTTGGVMSEAAAITAARALISDANGIPTHSTVTGTELSYVSGVTSAIQAQLDALTTAAGNKVAKAGDTMTGNLVMNAEKEVRFADNNSDHFIGLKSPATVAADVTFTLPAADGTSGHVLKTDGAGNLGWVALPSAASDASYAAKGVVQFLTDAPTSGLTVAAGVVNVNTGLGTNQIVKLPTAGTLPVLNGSALTNIDVAAITSASGKWLSYKPDGTECADGEILKWVAATDRWICGTAADLGAITSVVAGTGLDVNTVAGAATVSVEAELGALNGLATTGYVQRTGAATYSTTAGNTLNSNSTVVTRDGSGVSGFSGVLLNNASMNVTQVAPAAGTSYTVTWPAAAATVNGQVLTSTTGGVMSWVSALTTVTSADIVDGTIVNADINAAAAIDRTKFANGTANRVVINTTGGVMSEAAAITANSALISDANGIPTHSATVSATELGYLDGVTSAIQTQMDAKVAKAGDTMTGNLVMNAQKEVRFADSDSDHFVAVRSPATVAADVTLTLPTTAGAADQVLKTDGSGNLSWVALPAGTVDASYAAKGVVQLDTNLATSGLAVTAGVIKVNTGLGADQIVKLPTAGTLPVLNGSALTNIDVANIVSATGKYFKYMPNGIECADGEILKWVAASDQWICGTVASLGAITSVVAGTGLDVNTVAGAATVSVEAELGALNGLATTGYVQRTGAATYSTTTGNTLNSNSTVVTRDGSGVSGFSGVLLNNASMNVTQTAPAAGTSYSVTWPAAAPVSNGQILSSTTAGVMSWVNASTGTGDFLANGTVPMTGQLRNIAGTAALPGMTFVGDTNTGISAATADTMVLSTAGTSRVTIDPTGQVGIGTSSPTSLLHASADSPIVRIENSSTSAFTSARLYMTSSELNATGGIFYFMSEKLSAGAATGGSDFQFRVTDAGGNRTDLLYVPSDTRDIIFNGSKTAGGVYGNLLLTNGNLGIGTSTPGAPLDVKGAIRMSGSASGYTGFQPAAAAGSTVWTLPAVDGTAGYVLKTDGAGNLGWVALPGASVDASYAAKGVVQFNTDEATSGMTVASGVATVKRTTAALASTILQLDASSKAMVKGLDLKGTTNSVSILPTAGTAAYSLTLPAAQGANGEVLINNGSGVYAWGLPAVNSAAITDGSIMDADVNAAAAITRSKLATGSNWHVLINNGSGVMSSEANLDVSRGGTGNSSFTANSLVISGATSTSALSSLVCSVGQVPFFNGTTYACSTDFVAAAVASAVNYVLLTGSTGTGTVKVTAAGTGANLDLTLTAKGTGQVKTDSVLNVNATYTEKASTEGSGSVTLPVTSNIYRHVLANATAATLTLPACPASGANSFSLTVKVKQSAAGTGTITWAGSVTWDSATVPDATTVAAGVTIYQFLCIGDDSPATWYGMQVWKN
jgi:hypothetical protein